MTLDKSWTKITNKIDPTFIKGATAFAERGKTYADSDGRIHCPCRKCVNARRHVPSVVTTHIIHNGFTPTYNVWIYHGEHLPGYESDETNEIEESENESNDCVHELLDDAFTRGVETESENNMDDPNQHNNPNVDKLFVDMEKPLYPGCEDFSGLGFLLELMNVKVTCKMTNVSMDMILNLFSRAFKDANLPKNNYEAKKYLRTLGLGYESIHACKNDCALFWKENEKLQICPVCKTSRYEENSKGKKKPVKVLRYFPITSRLKRLYACRHTAREMSWHDRQRTKEEGVLRHPADGKAWKHFDEMFPDFADDPRNVRLGLASDGFNPFGAMSLSYSMWPVVLIPYNMPPWKSMVDASFMLTLLIPGKNSPRNNIDVYLRPLVDELKLLWDEGVETYDCDSKKIFNMRAALLWTINDFPAYGYLSGWKTSGYKACPICNEDASSVRIRDRIAYVGHRRFLEPNDPWRNARDFNGKREPRIAPKPVNGDDCLRQLENLSIHHQGKEDSHGGKKRKLDAPKLNWSKKSIFFELPYWHKLLIRHNIDVMHVEKNVFMVHLCVHLPEEAILGGPVQSRWMYPIERHLGHLKRFVGNRAKPEGSIAEGYVVKEAITFCSHYLRGVESKLDKRERNNDKTSCDDQSFMLDVFRVNGRGIGKKEVRILPSDLMKKALWYILNNCQEAQPYLEEHLQVLKSKHPQSSDFTEMQRSTFPAWFATRIRENYNLNPSQINEELYSLSSLPDNRVIYHKGYIVNGVKFLVKSRDDCRQTQNCGITVPGVHNDVQDDYYGYLDEVIELSFIKGCRVILFKCKWFDTNRQRKHVIFEPHFISIDTSRNAYMEDPFILASQAQQVFYINDPLKSNSNWKIIERIAHRHLSDIPEDDNAGDLLEDVSLLREDTTGEMLENVYGGGFDRTIDDFIDDEIDNSDHSLEDIASDSDLDDSDTGAEAMFVDILRFACFADYMHHCSEADRPIKDMTLIAEYIGDVDYINNREHDDCESMMSLLLASDPSKSLVICPDQCGKIARFINGINNFAP
ncbi:hypothetical protein SSX86_029931 [Deinandra increscens subsp. villosa]|uniref:Transposase n=1 Tax=Deinandra increscens subsp. villosa TaxID=3103831 RepID=A0AAP0CDI8_9ASTR